MNAVKVAICAVVVLIAALITGWHRLDELFYVLIGLLGLALIWSLLARRGLALQRQASLTHGQVGQHLQERLTLANSGLFPALWVEVHDRSTLPGHQASRVTSLGPHQRQRWATTTLLTRRGRFLLGPARLRTGDPFGLFPVELPLKDTVELLVYPATVPLNGAQVLAGNLPGGDRTRWHTPHLTPNLGGIREYGPGDSFNRIAWSATARVGRLMVKEFELDPTADIWLVLDLAAWVHLPLGQSAPLPIEAEIWRETTEELAVTVAASLAQHLLAEQRSVGLLMAGQQFVVLPTDRGHRQHGKLLEALAVVSADGSHSLGELLTAEAARFNRHSMLVIITPDTDPIWLSALASLTPSGPRAAAILIDASSFGGTTGAPFPVGQLAAQGVPTTILSRYDDLSAAIGQLSNRSVPTLPRWRRPEGR